MAKKAGKSQRAPNLFARLGAAKTRQLIESLFPNVSQSGVRRSFTVRDDEVITNCVLLDHHDTDPSLHIDCKRGYAHCYGSGCNYETANLLQLLQDAGGWTFKEAVSKIHTATGVRVVTDKVEKELDALDDHQQATATAMQACNEHLARCLNPPTSGPYANDYSPAFLKVVKKTLDWLFVERGRRPEYVSRLPYGVLPSQELLLKFCKEILDARSVAQAKTGSITLTKERRAKILTRIEEMFKDVDAEWVHCVTFHTGYGMTTPGRIRLRRPTNDKNNGGTDTLPGLKEDDPVGFFGLYFPNHKAFSAREVAEMHILVVEGENDALAYTEGLVASGKSGVRVLAAIGNHNEPFGGVDLLADAGISRVHLFGDEPSPEYGKGEEWVRGMLAKANRVDARVFTGWHLLAEGNPKDPDDAIRTHGFDRVYALTVGAEARYLTAEAWALDKLAEHTAGVDPSETREKLKWAIEYGHCVKNPTAFAVFLEQASRLVGIPQGPLRQEIDKTTFTEHGYVARLADTLLHEFHRVCREDGGRNEITLFHRRQRRTVRFYMSDGKGMMAQLANVFGDMWCYFRDNVGLPPALDDANLEGTSSALLLPDKLRLLQGYLEMAMQTVYQGVFSRSECVELGQGIWYRDDPEKPSIKCVYVVNGDRVYKGRWRPGDEPLIEWGELVGPSDGRYLFKVDTTMRWSKEINGVEDLNQGNTITKADILASVQNVRKMFFELWRFKHQSTDATFLAYHLAALAATAAFPTKSVVHILGDTGAGKSTLVSCFGGTQFDSLRLVECSWYRANYSTAFVVQYWNNTTMNMLLDEFEADMSTRSHKGAQVENISEMLRQIATEGGSDPGRGTNDGSPRAYHLQTNVILSSILRAALPQDNNRRMTIEVHYNTSANARPPDLVVEETIGTANYLAMRRLFTLGFLRFFPELHRRARDVQRNIAQVRRASYNVPARFSDNLVPAVTIMDHLGQDWDAFLRETFESRKDSILEVVQDTASNALFERLLGVPNVPLGSGLRASIVQLISRADSVSMLNTSGTGAFFDETNKVLIIDWYTVTAPNGLLYRVAEYESMRPMNLKHLFDQIPGALKTREYVSYNVLNFLRVLGHGGTERNVSAILMAEYVERIRAAIQQQVPSGNVVALPERKRAASDGSENV